MSGKPASIKIERVMKKSRETRDYKPPKTGSYTIFKFLCEGEANGKRQDLMEVKTMDENVAKSIDSGWSGNAEEQEYKGEISYFIPGQRQGGRGAGGGGGRGYTPRDSVSEEFAKAPCMVISYSKDIAIHNASLSKKPVQASDVIAIAGPLFDWIASTMPKARPPATAAAAPEPPVRWLAALKEAGLVETCQKHKLAATFLEALYQRSGGTDESFLKAVRDLLPPEKEEAEGEGGKEEDDLPF